jgi:hypothetical protein
MDNPNPVKAAREALGLSRKGFCAVSGISYQAQVYAECGYCLTIPNKIKDAFSKMGIDANKLDNAYRSWRKTSGQEELVATKN